LVAHEAGSSHFTEWRHREAFNRYEDPEPPPSPSSSLDGSALYTMSITFKLEPRDLRSFQRYALKHLPSARRVRYTITAMLVAFCLWQTFSVHDHRTDFRIVSRIVYFCVLMLIFWLFMRLWMFVALRISQWRSYTSEKHRSVLCEHTITLSDDALVEVTPFSEGRNLWNGIYRVVDAPDYIYIFISLHLAHIIPKSAFPDAESARRFYERAVSLQSGAQKVAV
jgi:hypothetical protein